MPLKGYKHLECSTCGTEIGFSEFHEKLPEGVRCGYCSMLAAKTCTWSAEAECGEPVSGYETSCGKGFEFTELTCKEAGAKFCIFCGGAIDEVLDELDDGYKALTAELKEIESE